MRDGGIYGMPPAARSDASDRQLRLTCCRLQRELHVDVMYYQYAVVASATPYRAPSLVLGCSGLLPNIQTMFFVTSFHYRSGRISEWTMRTWVHPVVTLPAARFTAASPLSGELYWSRLDDH
eukprot:5573282-Pleurochrysis_carterae.AAC.11